jgi:hypothetical protein
MNTTLPHELSLAGIVDWRLFGNCLSSHTKTNTATTDDHI